MSKKWFTIVLILATVAVAAFFIFRTNATMVSSKIEIELLEYSDSGQSGTATLTDEDGKLKVILDLSGYGADNPQPAHIHTGNCSRIGPVVYALNDVVNNYSETELSTDLDTLLTGNETLSVNTHASYDDYATYTSCGDIK